MPETPLGLDNPAFHGRLRSPATWELAPRRTDYTAPARRPSTQNQASPRPALPASRPVPQPLAEVSSTPPVQNDQQSATPVAAAPAATVARRFIRESDSRPWPLHTHSKLQLSLVGMAVLIFVIGLAVSLQTLLANHNTTAQVSALSKKADKQTNSSLPSTTKPSTQAVSQYFVAPDLPRYLNIPGLGVHARVLQTGITSSGALGTPGNVYDTAWYTGSAKPGQPGATLIDGHVSSWTTHGVFYGLKKLVAGDTMQIIRGDGTVLSYRVVRTQIYSDDNVDMQAAMTPVTPGKSGLNLITCTGRVKPGTNEFNQRILVFAEQI